MADSCHWTKDKYGMVPLTEMVSQVPPLCPVPPDVRGFYLPQVVYDKHGHRLTGDFDPLGKGGCNHRSSPEWKAEHRKKVKMETTTVLDTTSAPESTTIASIGARTHIPVKMDVGAENTVIVGLLAGLLGAGAIQLIGNLLKASNKKVDTSKEKRESSTECRTHHMKCVIYQQNVNAKLAALEGKVGTLEVREWEISPSFSKLDELVERVEKLEKKK